ncbi:MAG: type II secretion system protein N [Candidatus Competibacteraceae bacterium]|nr:type II secretion system protein N [Candidatus Competibacteraceae bacterium]
MKRIRNYTLLGLVAFLFFLLTLAPATLVSEQISARLPGFSMQGVEGSAIQGTILGARWHGIRLERLTWRWRPLTLLMGQLGFSLKIDDPEIKLTGEATTGFNRQISFQNLVGGLPLNRLSSLSGAASTPLEGVAEFNLRDLILNPAGWPLVAEGTVRLLNLRVTLGRPLIFGDYAAQINSTGAEGIQAKIKDNNAALMFDGALNLTPDGRYRLGGHAAIRDPGNQALRQALTLLGPPGGDGRWPVNFSGTLGR